MLRAHGVEMPDERDSRSARAGRRVHDQAVVKTRDRLAAEARGQPILDVIAQLRLFADRAWNPSQRQQRVAKGVADVRHPAEPSRELR